MISEVRGSGYCYKPKKIERKLKERILEAEEEICYSISVSSVIPMCLYNGTEASYL